MQNLTIFFCLILLLPITNSVFAQTEYRVYVEPLPDWANYAGTVMYDATKAWEDANPQIKFYQVDDLGQADFMVQWVKEFGVEHVGYAFGNQFIEVGLGDSNCGERWQPFSSNYVTHIMKHEIGHILNLEHSSDPDDIMYPVALNREYGIVEQEFTLTNNYAQFVQICSSNDVTSYSYEVSTDDPTYGFDVYFVPSIDEFYKWQKGNQFSYYADEGCRGENFLQYGGTCEGVANESGLLIIIGDKVTTPLTKVTIKLQEISSTSAILTDQSPSKSSSISDSLPTAPTSYSLYVDDSGRFSLEYPTGWIIEKNDPDGSLVTFLDEYDWKSAIGIFYIENTGYAGFSDKQILTDMTNYEKSICAESSYAVDQQICYGFTIVSSDVLDLSSDLKSYGLTYQATKQYSDPNFSGEYDMVFAVIDFVDGDNVWQIFTETDYDILDTYGISLAHSFDSFKVLVSGLTSTPSSPTPKPIPIPIPTPIPTPTPTPSSEIIASEGVGTAKIDQTTFEIGPYESKQVKIYGTVFDARKGDRIALTITYPDGTTNGNLVFLTDQGHYENYIILDQNSPKGTYEVLVSAKQKIIGILHFEVTAKGLLQPSEPQNVFEASKNPEASQSIPDWIKNNAKWWAAGQIDDDDFVNGIQFLMKEKIVMVPDLPPQASEKARPSFVDESKDPQSYIDRYNNEENYKEWFDKNYPNYTIEEAVGITASIPGWIKNTASWWSEGLITEDEFIKGIEFLVKQGIIRV